MNVLVGCEYSAIVRDAFCRRGHNAWSCDFQPCEGDPRLHYQEDIRIAVKRQPWDLLIVHPECTFLCNSGLHWNGRGRLVNGRPRQELTEEALQFVCFLLNLPIPKIALENPRGCISTRIRPPSQTIQPHEFGEDASKATCLWLKGLPLLTPTKHIPPRYVCQDCGKTDCWTMGQCERCGSMRVRPRWANQTDSGQNKLTPSADRWKDRSRTYKGIANAMANQWGKHD